MAMIASESVRKRPKRTIRTRPNHSVRIVSECPNPSESVLSGHPATRPKPSECVYIRTDIRTLEAFGQKVAGHE